ncbi:helix-turn-helix domain-containing protein [Leptolyngbya sp. FACHB-16]|uniref:helix-turn-helix domain-containing protein n=1 Tax=unclassified Leptolyngbya TaxID=2650499 RepID=UPI0016835803|nr:helix-turn-helix domain-containing protein [Leptolyngbya sp. FACHB-16]MBD2156220.1 transposase [Leptolyngbya sp. FACHB-16]
MAKYTPEFKEEVKQAYLSGNESLSAIASQFGVGERTVEGWSKEGGWDGLKKASKVVPIGEGKKKAKPAQANDYDDAPRIRRSPNSLDPLQLVDTALYDVSGMMGGGEDGREIAALAGALCKLIELKLKLEPPTAAALAERVIALGLTPHEFAAALKDQWRLKA